MKTKETVQRTWITEFVNPIAVSGSFSNETRAELKVEIAKEVDWVVQAPNYVEMIPLRVDKIDSLLAAHDNDISGFDPFYAYRKLFFEWVQA